MLRYSSYYANPRSVIWHTIELIQWEWTLAHLALTLEVNRHLFNFRIPLGRERERELPTSYLPVRYHRGNLVAFLRIRYDLEQYLTCFLRINELYLLVRLTPNNDGDSTIPPQVTRVAGSVLQSMLHSIPPEHQIVIERHITPPGRDHIW